jgi:type IV pilus assembly protein PilA
MVVVAIIGILAAMSVGQVSKQIAKSRQAESRNNLSSLYGAEKSFQAEWSSYTGDFQAIGLSFDGNLRYSIGFGAMGVAATAAAIPGYTGGASGVFQSIAGACVGNCTVINSNGVAPTNPGAAAVLTANNFIAEARAMIFVPTGGGGTEDWWQINASKVFTNNQVGIP